MEPTTLTPTTMVPTTTIPTTIAPTTALPTMVPTYAPTATPSPTGNPKLILGVGISGVIVVIAVILYIQRKTMKPFFLKCGYYLTCCWRFWRERQRAAAERRDFESLNSLLFEVNNAEEIGRVNISELTHDDGENSSSQLRSPVEVSVNSFFPDLLGDDTPRSASNSRNDNSQNRSRAEYQDEANDNDLQESLL